MISIVIDIVLLVFLLVMALAILKTPRLFAMAMLFGLYSLLVAALFLILDAPDVAFTEAAVGTGISTILFLATLAATKVSREKPRKGNSAAALLVTLAFGGLLIFGTLDIANIGDANAPPHTEVAARYIEEGPKETGVPNLVTAVLASYRGFDTLGEVTVVFTACIAVLLLLQRREKPKVKVVNEGLDER